MIRSNTLILLLLGAIALGSGIWLGQRLLQPPVPPELAELDKLTRAMGVLYRVPEDPEDPDNYLVDHSSTVLLINPNGALQAVFTPPRDPATLTADFRKIREYYRAVN